MSTIAILSALPQEQGSLVAALQQSEKITHAGRTFWRGTLHGHAVVLALSGIGKVAAATTTTALIERFGAGRIVFTGVAGGLGAHVQVGDVVVAQDYLQHDMDASPIVDRWLVPGYPQIRMACDPSLTEALLAATRATVERDSHQIDWPSLGMAAHHVPQVHAGLIASGDRFVSTLAESTALRSALESAGHAVLAVEMEGAAVAQVCADYGVAFAAVRTVSDRADDGAHLDFLQFVETVAARYADHVVHAFLKSL
ncbi:5'-methylthioadenosine/adenosylhomocysteine nucleosidase [Diaphorobacter caeni]|uniref:5'-methylthioadenosine/adenosylhomocysteine nucleosidase n=1 Tax=Diaphorobacter caeni TaxID=2784387 RepID=UPI00188FEC68|nr:5'-methylthioadenosine/adenosylhomocysteine nucleosidase [Diaphorobacter caeni]MBF5004780.1 5'-methylthioadenosine/adenosylhomocysteine nucleosidase [Diaphorobacter caeni]